MPNGLLTADSLRVHPDGFALALTMPWYRSLWLSSVSSLELSVDGEPVEPGDLTFELNGTRYPLEDLPSQSEVLWYVQDHPLLIVRRDPPVRLQDSLQVALHGELRLPYMQLAPGENGGPGEYVPNTVHQELELVATDAPTPPPVFTNEQPSLPPNSASDPFQLGITLYSVSSEFRAGWYDFSGLLDKVSDFGIGPGIEIVASQALPTYPAVSDDFVRIWRNAFDRHGFKASSFGANLDMGRRRDRDMTQDEEFEFSKLLFHGAHQLGFPLVRIQSAQPALLRRLLPVAEKLELKLAYEIHAPNSPSSDRIMAVRETFAALDSPLLGFVADFSATMHSMSPILLKAFRKAGLNDEAIAKVQAIWATDASMRARQEEFIAYLRDSGFDPGRLGPFAHLAFNMHGHVDPREWLEIMPQIMHVHAKFYDIDADGQEPSIDYPKLVRTFIEGGFRGFWSSEWEGHVFADPGDIDPLHLVRRQHDLIRSAMRSQENH